MSSKNNNKKNQKSTANTIFVRFLSSTNSNNNNIASSIERHHLEDYFSNVGPIQKCSLIRSNNNNNSRYGFVKFVSQQDAREAARSCDSQILTIPAKKNNDTTSTMISVKLKVELASNDRNKYNATAAAAGSPSSDSVNNNNDNNKKTRQQQHARAHDDDDDHHHRDAHHPNDDDNHNNDDDELLQRQQQQQRRKRTCRVIVRNVSFRAKESHVREVMEERFGPVAQVDLPKVHTAANNNNNKILQQQHRGFAFVTFQNARDAQKAIHNNHNNNVAAQQQQQQQQQQQPPILIKSRPVAIDYSVSKTQHQRLRRLEEEEEVHNNDNQEDTKQDNQEDNQETKDDSSSSSGSDDQDDDDGDGTSTSDSSQSDDDDESDASIASDDAQDHDGKEANNNNKKEKRVPPPPPPEHDPAVQDHRTLFVRNLPFDATRHDIFELLSKYGRIASIHLVKDKTTGVSKGTAFCSFESVESAQKVLEDSGSGGDFVSQRQGGGTTGTSTATSSAGLYIRGRRLFVDLAVDKKTASTLTAEKREDGTKIHGKDRRNLYLKMEGRVMAANQHQDAGGKSDNHHGNNNLAWESLPESDQLKRQRAFAEKNTKLRSPLFFINPNRLSIRNLAKHVDEADLKRLVVQATLRGLETNLVSQEDQVAHWRASGETTTRDIIRRINAAKDESNPDGTVIPAFDEKNVKKFIPSVFIDRDFTTNKKEKAPSRGFGFVDFQHHAHALACLRELNNNPYYSEDYVAGGKRAAEMKRSAKRTKPKKKKSETPSGEFMGHDGRVQVPRLIVDFTVENKAKAKKQAEHRAQQHANIEKQRLERREKILTGEVIATKKKKSRGKLQREKKRKQREGGTTGEEVLDEDTAVPASTHDKQSAHRSADSVKKVKPPKKKRKADKEDEKFESLVDTYRTAFSNAVGSTTSKQDGKRWFED